MNRTARLSLCRTYRYELRRVWHPAKPLVAFVMLNPSKADNNVDDPTTRKCMGFAYRWNFGGVILLNLFAYRATDPDDLFLAQKQKFDIVGPENDATIQSALSDAKKIVVAWGTKGGPTLRALEVSTALNAPVEALKISAQGHPWHPLYVPYQAQLVKWKHPSQI